MDHISPITRRAVLAKLMFGAALFCLPPLPGCGAQRQTASSTSGAASEKPSQLESWGVPTGHERTLTLDATLRTCLVERFWPRHHYLPYLRGYFLSNHKGKSLALLPQDCPLQMTKGLYLDNVNSALIVRIEGEKVIGITPLRRLVEAGRYGIEFNDSNSGNDRESRVLLYDPKEGGAKLHLDLLKCEYKWPGIENSRISDVPESMKRYLGPAMPEDWKWDPKAKMLVPAMWSIDPANPEIQRASQSLRGDGYTLETLRRAFGWAEERLNHPVPPHTNLAGVANTLKAGGGPCYSHSIVKTSLARALGIPARAISGFAVSDIRGQDISRHSHGKDIYFFQGVGWVPFDSFAGANAEPDSLYGDFVIWTFDDGRASSVLWDLVASPFGSQPMMLKEVSSR